MVKVMKKAVIALLLLTAPCRAMQMDIQSNQSIQTMDEVSAIEIIQRLLGKKYIDIKSELATFSDSDKKLLLTVLNKKHSLNHLFIPHVRF